MKDRLIQLVAVVVLIAGIAGAFLLTSGINEKRVEQKLTYDLDSGDDTNPVYTFVSMLGPVRGFAVNVLWQRSEALKQEGKFFEANNLAEMITTLQPRYPEAWNFQGWNMAYNISVKCKTADERWDWVKKGMNLIRDRGIPNNPNGVVLYRSLAWIMGHKMAGYTDDMHWTYKSNFAEEWQVLLGQPMEGWFLKPEYRTAKYIKLQQQRQLDPLIYGEWRATERFRMIVESAEEYLLKPERKADSYGSANYFTTLSPETLERFYDDNPGLEQAVREIESLTGPDGESLGLGLNTQTALAFGRMQMFGDAGYKLDAPAIDNPETLGLDAMALNRWLIEPRDGPLNLIPLVDLLRARALIADYHMDPAYMLKCMETYGPIDWRHPSAHACYWTALGTLRANTWVNNKDRLDLVNANRATIHALQELAHRGKITFRPAVPGVNEVTINFTSDTRMIPAYARAWRDALDKIEAGEYGENHKTNTYTDGHENFLQAAVYLYYFEGNEGQAKKYYDEVVKLYSERDNSPAREEGHYRLSLRDFAVVRLADDMKFQDVALINYFIRQAWQEGLAQNDQGVMNRYLNMAEQKYKQYHEDGQTEIRGQDVGQVAARQAIPLKFNELVLSHFIEMISSTEYSLRKKAQIWSYARPRLNNMGIDNYTAAFHAFRIMWPILERQAESEGWSTERLRQFQPPNGFQENYDNWLKTRPTPIQQTK